MKIVRYHFSSIDSTNNWVKAHISELDAAALTLVTADEQTAGRGRLNRRWISPSSVNVYGTFAFFTDKSQHDLGNISQVMAVCAAETLQQLGFEVQCKWPNDLILSKKKVGGILCETTPCPQGLCVIAGVGINVNMAQDMLSGVGQPATSLFVECGCEQSVEAIVEALSDEFQKSLTRFLHVGFHPFLSRYKQVLMHHHGDSVREGTFHSIEPDGSIAIRLPTGDVKRFHSVELG